MRLRVVRTVQRKIDLAVQTLREEVDRILGFVFV